MQSVSEQWKEQIYDRPVLFVRAEVELLTGETLYLDYEDSDDDFMANGISLQDNATNNNSFTIGTAVMNAFSFTLNNMDGRFSTTPFNGAKIKPYFGMKLEDGTIEWVKKGVFNISNSGSNLPTLAFTTYDNMSKMELPFSDVSISYPVTLGNMAQAICNYCQVELANTSFDNSDYVVESAPIGTEYSCRQMLSYIAQISGGFAKFNADGKLEIKRYESVAQEIPVYKKIKKEKEDITIAGVQVTSYYNEDALSEDSNDNTATSLTGSDGFIISVSENPLIPYGKEKEVSTYLGEKLNGTTFSPIEVSTFYNPSIEAGDKLSIEDVNGNVYVFFVTNLSVKIGSYVSLICTAETQQENVANRYSNSASAIVRVLDVVNAKIQNLVTTHLEAEVAKFGYLTADKADLKYASIDLANIDVADVQTLFTKVGLIKDAVIVDGHITGYLDAVSINANSIKAGTLAVDRLVLNGSDESLIFALNNIGELTSTNVDTLDGGLLTKRTITADHLVADTITSNELNVAQIFADATVINTLTASDAFIKQLTSNSVIVGALTGPKGDTGNDGTSVTILSTSVTYKASTSGTETPSDSGWSTSVPTVPKGQYLWTKMSVKFSDGTEVVTYSVSRSGTDGENGASGSNGTSVNVTSTNVTYGTSTSASTKPSSWSETIPSVAEGSYLWTRTIVTYSDGNSTTTYTYAKQGEKGKDGEDGADGTNGVGVSKITNYYLATNSSSGVTTSTSGWTEGVQSVSSSKKYLWNYEKVTYTDNSTSTTTPCIIGAYGDTGPQGGQGPQGVQGDTGNGIKSIAEYYAVSASNSSAPSSWSTSVPTMTSTNKYLWNYEVITYTSGSTVETAKRVIGVYGDTGSQGATGKGISSIVHQYYLSTSNTSQTGGSWSSTIPAYVSGRYYWERDYITWTDGTTSTTTAVLSSAYNEAILKANTAYGSVADWCYENDLTWIDGGNIYAGTVTAKQINVEDLFAQDIIATGTISGATLIGDEISIGENSLSSVIKLCGGVGEIRVVADSEDTDALYISAPSLGIDSYSVYEGYGSSSGFVGVDSTAYEDYSQGHVRLEAYCDAPNNWIAQASIDISATSEGASIGFGFVDSNVAYNVLLDEYGFLVQAPIILPNNTKIMGTTSSGATREAFNPANGSNQCVVGAGNYSAGDADTSVRGKDVLLYTSAAGNANYRPYYRAGDSITLALNKGGHVTSSSKSVCFSVGLPKPVIGSPTVTVTSSSGLKIRQGGNYTHGSSSSAYAKPSSYSATLYANGIVVIDATMSSITNAVNNDACGIYASITITFS